MEVEAEVEFPEIEVEIEPEAEAASANDVEIPLHLQIQILQKGLMDSYQALRATKIIRDKTVRKAKEKVLQAKCDQIDAQLAVALAKEKSVTS